MAEPMRTCIGCGARREKAGLVRLVARDGIINVDAESRAPGRGAYVCDGTCARVAETKRAFARSLRTRALAGKGLCDEVEAAKRRRVATQ